jgi:tetratricopeptide (TPR) repeat protein
VVRFRCFSTVLGCAVLVAGVAQAAMSVLGGGMAEACSKAAIAERFDAGSVAICDSALEAESLDLHDRAGTYINRGVMRLRREQFELARADFDAAIEISPAIGEAWVNRGAAMIGEHRYKDALADIDKALGLGVKEPEKAYFNRGLAHEGLDDEAAAYFDYKQALVLKPGWNLPEHELLRFTVTPRS